MSWIELFLAMLPAIIEFLPAILDLFDKDAKARAEAIPKCDALFNTSVKAGNIPGMIVGLVGGCICRMNDEQFARFKPKAEKAIAAAREAKAAMDKGDD